MNKFLAMMAAAALLMMQAGTVMGQGAKEDPMDTTGFAVELYGRVAADAGGGKGNVFFSPASVEVALGMTYAGARGTTAEQMGKVLHVSGGPEKVAGEFAGLLKSLNGPEGQKERAYQLVIADALWGAKEYPFQADFTRLAEKDFGAGLKPVDFGRPEEARGEINKWVADKTRGKIENLLGAGDITPATRLVLTNAIYFKSAWQEPFQKGATKTGPFKVSRGNTVDAEMMHQRHAFGYFEDAQMQLLELPYAQGKLSMVVLLPKQDDGVAALEKSLTAERLRGWLKGTKEESVEVTLPKFTFSSEMGLGETLKEMGMTDAFDPEKADFSGMSTAEHLFLSAVVHKAYVAVDEEGTEAAAATGAVMTATAMRMFGEPKKFVADHPFVFLIREKATGEVLFMGRVCNPAGK